MRHYGGSFQVPAADSLVEGAPLDSTFRFVEGLSTLPPGCVLSLTCMSLSHVANAIVLGACSYA